jgi:hypothetical protein
MQSARLVRHSRPKGGATDRPEPETMAEGLNEWERQVGLPSYERIAAEYAAQADPEGERAG